MRQSKYTFEKTRGRSVNILLADMAGFAEMNEAWGTQVTSGQADTGATVESRLAHPDLPVEMTVIAAK
ncbi:Rid family hydrolase [Neorhizobium sp. JUb45]|uniref:Rid family hydrolase n=1 Tax=Neorhizobium sp. JUb45 TaxID=2485113 RepID=UPI001044B292|nr:Rid family hydrolase [Neorhizobium sp. JUb45]TCQ95882.1 endoribonuclease L-PSP [Neorhizobium sp. JUb45]